MKTFHDKWAVWLTLALALLFAGSRLWGAWAMRYDVNHDFVVVQIMVRHVLAGHPWPCFFYGQAYMGTLEPFVSALLAAILGYSTFIVNCGTALFSIGTMALTLHWAKRLGGWPAAWPTALALVGAPLAFFHYNVSPRGGYGSLLFFTVAILYFGYRILPAPGRPLRHGFVKFGLLGLLAGLGLWNHMLVAPALMAVGVTFLLRSPRALCRPYPWLGGLAGLVTGLVPLIFWNARHDWATFAMSSSVILDPLTLVRNFHVLASQRWPHLLAVEHAGTVGRLSVSLASLAVILPALAARLPDREISDDRPRPSLLSLWILLGNYLVVFVACFSMTDYARFHTPRYLLPLVPVMALLAGIGCAHARPRGLRLAALGLVVLLGAWNLVHLPAFLQRAERGRQQSARLARVVEKLEDHGVTAAYASHLLYDLNLESGEGINFSDPRLERIPAYRRRLELDPAPAAVEDFGGVSSWIPSAGGKASFTNIASIRLCYDIKPPELDVIELPADAWPQALTSEGRNLQPVLTDRCLLTRHLAQSDDPSRPWTLTIRLEPARELAGVRLWGAENLPFHTWSACGRASPDAAFEALSGPSVFPYFFWSGPRMFWDRPHLRQELRFAPRALTELRLRFQAAPHGASFILPELQLLQPREPATPVPLHRLLRLLTERGIQRLYADRWTANQVHVATRGTVWTSHALAQPDIAQAIIVPQDKSRMTLDPDTAVLIPPAGAGSLRETAARHAISFRETELGTLGILFDRPSLDQQPLTAPHDPGLRFLGAYVVLADDLARALHALPEQQDASTRTTGFPPALDTYGAQLLRHRLLWRADLPTNAQDAERLARQLEPLTTPTLGAPIDFGPHGTWLGARILPDKREWRPGDHFTLRHYWVADRKPPPNNLIFFVHLIGPDKFIFQDDHPLLYGDFPYASDRQEPWIVDRFITIPPDAPPGRYRLRIGLCDAKFNGKRFKLRTRLPTSRRAARVEEIFTVRRP